MSMVAGAFHSDHLLAASAGTEFLEWLARMSRGADQLAPWVRPGTTRASAETLRARRTLRAALKGTRHLHEATCLAIDFRDADGLTLFAVDQIENQVGFFKARDLIAAAYALSERERRALWDFSCAW